jgi:hypothetical protein
MRSRGLPARSVLLALIALVGLATPAAARSAAEEAPPKVAIIVGPV